MLPSLGYADGFVRGRTSVSISTRVRGEITVGSSEPLPHAVGRTTVVVGGPRSIYLRPFDALNAGIIGCQLGFWRLWLMVTT